YSGGIVSSLHVLIPELQKQGHTVSLITLDFLGYEHSDPEYVMRISCPLKFMYKKNHMAIPWRATHALQKYFNEWQPDIIHAQHPFLLGRAALRVARKQNIPICFTYHSIYEAYAHYVPFPGTLTRPAIQKMVLDFCKKVNGIIV